MSTTLEKTINDLEKKKSGVIKELDQVQATIEKKSQALGAEYLSGKSNGLGPELQALDLKQRTLTQALQILESDLMGKREELQAVQREAKRSELDSEVKAIMESLRDEGARLIAMEQLQRELRPKLEKIMFESADAGLPEIAGMAQRLIQIWPWMAVARAANHLNMRRPYVEDTFLEALSDPKAEWKVKAS